MVQSKHGSELKLHGHFRSGDKVLLLERNSKHNDKTWGLPGGNVEAGDWTLLDTASREAKEELGNLPQYELITEIKTRHVPPHTKITSSGQFRGGGEGRGGAKSSLYVHLSLNFLKRSCVFEAARSSKQMGGTHCPRSPHNKEYASVS